MSIRENKNAFFSKASYEEWEKIVLKTLKSDSLETLYNETYEGIKLSPIYTIKDVKNRLEDAFICGSPPNNNWKISQKLCSSNWNELKQHLVEAKELGQETVSFDVDNFHDLQQLDFTEINKIFDLSCTPLLLFSKCNFQIIARRLLLMNTNHVFGSVAVDMISSQLEQGHLYKQEGQTWIEWKENLSKLDEKYPSLRTILIDSSSYHHSGANAVQELAITLSEAVFYIEELRKSGWEPYEAISKMIFHFSIGNNFFMEIAKLRAFRSLWKTIACAYQVPPEQSVPVISAETSAFTKSLLDPYTNILRSGNEAFAAVIGGVDYLHVTPFNSVSNPSDQFAMRIARNTQLLFREESYLDKVIDPAGGSFYIETLTFNLVEKAWELFQMIDSKGGIYSVLESGWLQDKVKETLKKRIEDLQTKEQLMIGVNAFRLDSNIKSLQKPKHHYRMKDDVIKIEPLELVRLAEKSESGEF
ncbi:methylmalonyl-CoA mutase family protein [Lederbergia wuyishanensis]|uniref:methylmalonyl-CoA mutase n=1 Tax=Lederbergia wuyishanensis TaxID=1347903 RepID=A0ABU0D166_9BACI|nr:methylmalonyl-CoA mutase family protein [Lederbergia wuyishanensis]MCJ8006770.1 methylmalonyl-CoA mutase family protein [Lederbergia wuyishanensis]MDQ0342152.1 methylmalonyl-CoA mutase [Lederbergia wuyishanensis]